MSTRRLSAAHWAVSFLFRPDTRSNVAREIEAETTRVGRLILETSPTDLIPPPPCVQLLAEYNSAEKEVQRGTFVHRILEIIKNIKHQEADIASIISDTRAVQKEIQVRASTVQWHSTAHHSTVYTVHSIRYTRVPCRRRSRYSRVLYSEVQYGPAGARTPTGVIPLSPSGLSSILLLP
eukprot:240318-Prorocentrum_minimum.AAC.1